MRNVNDSCGGDKQIPMLEVTLATIFDAAELTSEIFPCWLDARARRCARAYDSDAFAFESVDILRDARNCEPFALALHEARRDTFSKKRLYDLLSEKGDEARFELFLEALPDAGVFVSPLLTAAALAAGEGDSLELLCAELLLQLPPDEAQDVSDILALWESKGVRRLTAYLHFWIVFLRILPLSFFVLRVTG